MSLQDWSKSTKVAGSKQFISTHTVLEVPTRYPNPNTVKNNIHSPVSQGPSHLRFNGLDIYYTI